MPKQHGAKFLSDRKFQQQQPNHFEIIISGMGDEITFAVKSFPLPTRTTSPIELPYGNSVTKMAGPMTFGSGDLVLRDFMEADTEKKFLEWQDQVGDPKTGKMGLMADYKRTATVFEFAPDGSMVRKWTLEGVWPSAFNPGELSHDNGTQTKDCTATLEYDCGYRDDE